MVDYLQDLESTCSALGTSDGSTYLRDDDCIECVKDIVRFLRRDDGNHELRRRLGEIQVVQSDLLPLLRDHADDNELFDLVLRVLVNLTNPELLLYREELPEDKAARNFYLQLQSHRQSYKTAFVEEQVWKVLTEKLQKLLAKDAAERLEDEQLVIERILILVRNVLQAPRDASSESSLDTDISVHDQILWVLRKSNMQDLLLYIASAEDEMQYCLHVLEIISLMFREQDPRHLASANFQRSKEEKEADQRTLLNEVQREQESRRQRILHSSSRHSRFGGTFIVANMASITDGKKLVSHRPLQTHNSLDFDRAKRPKKLAVNKQTPKDDLKRRSTLAVRLFLKEFCIEFLTGAYNPLMLTVKDQLNRQRAQQNDESYYLWSIRFFMEFNRNYEFRADFVSETLNKATFHYVQQQIELYKDNFQHEKRNRAVYLLWSRRMHLALRAYQELLFTMVAMDKSDNPEIRESSKVLKVKVFYEPEYRELCLTLFTLYAPQKFSKGFLQDLVETNHVFIKIMEHMSSSKHLVIGKKVKKKMGGKVSAKTGKILSADASVRETKEDLWERVSSLISELLQSDDPLPAVSPFDATSDVPIEEQKVTSLYRLQQCLRKREASMALALLRASREVWPEGDVFGEEDAEPEDEFMTLREIMFAEIERPKGYVEEPQTATPADDATTETAVVPQPDPLDDSEPEINETDEEDEQERSRVETHTVDQEFDMKQLILRFASKDVCMAYARLFKDYRNNSMFTNHCIIKMFHRIAFDCKLPALFFQIQILRIFQNINKDMKVLKDTTTIKEMYKFAYFILGKFFENAATNKKVFMETCFWKTTNEAIEIIDGYEDRAGKYSKKASFWSEDDEEKLGRLFEQFKEMGNKPAEEGNEGESEKPPTDDADIVDNLESMFLESGKTRRQIIKKLKDMNLIESVKDLKSKKPRRRVGGGGRKKLRGDDNGDIGDNGGFRQQETDKEGNPIFKSKQWIESDDSSDEETPKVAESAPSARARINSSPDSSPEKRSPAKSMSSQPFSAPGTRTSRARIVSSPDSSPEKASPAKSAPSSPVATQSQHNRSPPTSPNSTLDDSRLSRRRSKSSLDSSIISRRSQSPNSTLNDSRISRRRSKSPVNLSIVSRRSPSPNSTLNDSRLSRRRSKSPVNSSIVSRRSPSPNSTLDYSRRTLTPSRGRSPASSLQGSPNTSRRTYRSSSSDRSRSRSRSSSPLTSRFNTPASSRLATPVSSAQKRPRPTSSTKKSGGNKKKRVQAKFLDSSDEETEVTENNGPDDDAVSSEEEDRSKESPIKKKRKRVVLMDSDSD